MSKIAPCLWFNGEVEQAAEFYVALFPGSKIESVSRWGDGGRFPKGTALMVEFTLFGQRFQALNAGPEAPPTDCVSLSIDCEDAAEVDRYWDALTADGGQEVQCGWLKDRFGFAWQVVPRGMGELIGDPDPARAARAMQAMIGMKKLDLVAMRAAAGLGVYSASRSISADSTRQASGVSTSSNTDSRTNTTARVLS